jgi:hypothetical protein
METARCSRMIKKTIMKRLALVHSCCTFLCAFITHFSSLVAQLLCNFSPLSFCATCHHSVVVQLVTTQLLCKLSPLSCCATCHHSAVMQFCNQSFFLQLVTQLVRNLSLGCPATCHQSFVLQLVTTQPFCDLVTTQLFYNLSPLSCSATGHSVVA